VQHLAVKAITSTVTEEGVFEAVISTESVDRERDVVAPAGMVRALRKWNRPIPLAWNHSTKAEDIFGHVDPSTVREIAGEVVAGGEVDLESKVGQEAWRSFKRRTVGFSFGYLIPEGGAKELEGGGRYITELDVFEITATTTPMNNDTRVLSTKAVAEHGVPTDAELRAQAKALGIEPPLSRRELRRQCDKVAFDAALGFEPPPDPTPPAETGPTARELRRRADQVALDAALGWEPLPSPEPDERSVPTADELRRRFAELGLSVPPSRSRDPKAVKLEARKRMLEVLGVSEEEVARWAS
jgi:HK97 family phage prohead protease